MPKGLDPRDVAVAQCHAVVSEYIKRSMARPEDLVGTLIQMQTNLLRAQCETRILYEYIKQAEITDPASFEANVFEVMKVKTREMARALKIQLNPDGSITRRPQILTPDGRPR